MNRISINFICSVTQILSYVCILPSNSHIQSLVEICKSSYLAYHSHSSIIFQPSLHIPYLIFSLTFGISSLVMIYVNDMREDWIWECKGISISLFLTYYYLFYHIWIIKRLIFTCFYTFYFTLYLFIFLYLKVLSYL